VLNGFNARCDNAHRHERTIPIVAPMTFNKMPRIGILIICTDEEAGDRWIYTIKTEQQIRATLDHIEAVALRRDQIVIAGLSSVTVVPILGFLIAFLLGILRNRRAEPGGV